MKIYVQHIGTLLHTIRRTLQAVLVHRYAQYTPRSAMPKKNTISQFVVWPFSQFGATKQEWIYIFRFHLSCCYFRYSRAEGEEKKCQSKSIIFLVFIRIDHYNKAYWYGSLSKLHKEQFYSVSVSRSSTLLQ